MKSHSLLTTAVALGLTGIASSTSCDIFTVAGNAPSNAELALKSYSYCGGYLYASAYIKNLDYDKLVTLYWNNKYHQSTPLNSGQLGYASSIDDNWEIWDFNASVVPDGVSTFLNLTFEATDIGQNYYQTFDSNFTVRATGDPIPDPAEPPIYKPYASPSGFSDDITEWIAATDGSEAALSLKRMLSNINIAGAYPGTVIAALSYFEPDYAYNWVRDSSLTMNVIERLYEVADSCTKPFYEKLLFEYANAAVGEQNDPDLLTYLGEPKFNLNNSAFLGPWGRPQNDGPATQAITLMEFADAYMSAGGSLDTVKEKIYDSNTYPTSAPVLRDLLYVAANWSAPSYDLWEEEESDHFYTRMVQRKALVYGAEFANKMGDTNTAAILTSAASELTQTLTQFWDKARQLILYEYGPVLKGKSSYKDVAVILGVLHGYANDGVFASTNDQILVTAYQIATSFLDIYPIAFTTKDNEGRTLGNPVGRYPEDVYNGVGTGEGNPWYLCTAAVSQLLYQAAEEFKSAGSITITSTSKPFWDYYAAGVTVETGTTYKSGSSQFTELVDALIGWGDAYFRTVKYYTPSGGHLTEEFDRNSGEPQGANDLTWSYAALLTNSFARESLRGVSDYIASISNLGYGINTTLSCTGTTSASSLTSTSASIPSAISSIYSNSAMPISSINSISTSVPSAISSTCNDNATSASVFRSVYTVSSTISGSLFVSTIVVTKPCTECEHKSAFLTGSEVESAIIYPSTVVTKTTTVSCSTGGSTISTAVATEPCSECLHKTTSAARQSTAVSSKTTTILTGSSLSQSIASWSSASSGEASSVATLESTAAPTVVEESNDGSKLALSVMAVVMAVYGTALVL